MATFQELLKEFFYRPEEEAGPLFELATGAAPSAPSAEASELEQYLAFSLAGECYAVPIASVREILRVPPLAEVPRAAYHLLGVMNLRGEILPVYDVKPRLGLAAQPASLPEDGLWPKGCRVVVMSSEGGDAGVLVDAVEQVVRLGPGMIEPPPAGLRAGSQSLMGLGRSGQQLFILVDMDRLLE